MEKFINQRNNQQDHQDHLPWIEKYRPESIDGIISQNRIINSLINFISKRTLPHLLFFGPSGSGKTSTIKCCAKQIYDNYIECMILELNASNDRGIDIVRTRIKTFVESDPRRFLPADRRDLFKLVILDEVDSMTDDAQCMLRQMIEKYSANVRFCLICNDIDRVNIALQSRCALFRFTPLKSGDIKDRLAEICQIEGITFDEEALLALVKISKGDMRSAINKLQHISLTIGNTITAKEIYNISGYCDKVIINMIYKLLIKVMNQPDSYQHVIKAICNIIDENNVVFSNLLDELKNIILDYKKFSIGQKIYLIENLARHEINDSLNVDPEMLVAFIASNFVIVKNQ